MLTRLSQRRVDKLWGRRKLPPPFTPVPADAEPVGEILFEHPSRDRPELLVKYLFTSAKLSVQVHPDNAVARSRGLPNGKDEAWIILDADDGATIGLGLINAIDRETLRDKALDGSIETLLDWRPVRKGDVIYAPAGTIHAIGEGISLIEVQQNLDLTYRLFDYGRNRPLQLEDALDVAIAAPFVAGAGPQSIDEHRTLLCSGAAFAVERWTGVSTRSLDLAPGKAAWIIPLTPGITVDGEAIAPGSVAILSGTATVDLAEGATTLIAKPAG